MANNLFKNADLEAMLEKFDKTTGLETVEILKESFMFRDGFIESKLFSRYREKLENDLFAFMEKETIPAKSESPNFVNLSEYMRDFFIYTFAADFLEDRKHEINGQGLDWRHNLIPLPDCVPGNLKNADAKILAGWKVLFERKNTWDEMFTDAFKIATVHFIHDMKIKYGDIGEDNFCIKAMPRNTADRFMFIKLLMNVIWTESWASFKLLERTKTKMLEEKVDSLKVEKKELKSEFKKYKNETAAAHKKIIAQLERDKQGEIKQQVDAYRSETNETLALERKKNKQLETELLKLKERYSQLEEQYQILSEADEDENEVMPEQALNYNSKIVFIASTPDDYQFELRFEKLRQRLPNCKFVHSASDIVPGADCYVLLTHYMKHHAIYNSSVNALRLHKLPYLHTRGQNIDRILHDIFERTRYTEQ